MGNTNNADGNGVNGQATYLPHTKQAHTHTHARAQKYKMRVG